MLWETRQFNFPSRLTLSVSTVVVLRRREKQQRWHPLRAPLFVKQKPTTPQLTILPTAG
jgi:hypothetical protein